MMVLPKSVRIVVLTRPVAFTTDVDGLARLVRDVLADDPLSGDIFCFFNPRRDRVKLLVWDRNGFWVMCKRLERGRFQLLERRTSRLELSREELVMLLEGVDMSSERFHRNFVHDVRISSRGDDDRPARAAR
jgi:transposase